MATQSTIYVGQGDGTSKNAASVFGSAGQFQHGYEGVGGANKLILQPKAAAGLIVSSQPSAENDVEHYPGTPTRYTYAASCQISGGTRPYTVTWHSSSGESGSGTSGTMHIDASGPNTYQCTCTFNVRDAAGNTGSSTASEILSLNG